MRKSFHLIVLFALIISLSSCLPKKSKDAVFFLMRGTPAEMDLILSILKNKYGLAAEHADALITEAEKELKNSVDLWQFASLINQNYSNEEKIEIIETLWQVVYVDGKMDDHEHYLMNKLKNLLRLSHNQLIDAKLKVLHGNNSARYT